MIFIHKQYLKTIVVVILNEERKSYLIQKIIILFIIVLFLLGCTYPISSMLSIKS